MKSLMPWSRKQVPIRRADDLDASYSLMQVPELERMFENFLGQWPSIPLALGATQDEFMPSIDIHETENAFELTAELPGMDEKEITVSLAREMLTISGEKKFEKEENREGTRRIERRYGSFARSVALPAHLETDKADAAYKNGVLTVTIPKSPEYKSSVRSIPVHAAEHGTKPNGGSATGGKLAS